MGNGWRVKIRGIRRLAEPRQLFRDLVAGLQGAVSSLPGGMAAAVLAGVHPIQGLYACVAGPIAGGLTAGTRLMIITTTGAVALAAGSALHNVSKPDRPGAIALLALLTAAALIVFGLLRFGRYTRFVSHSVMMGFLTGISINIVCGQLAGLTGVKAHGHVAVDQAIYVLVHPLRINPAALATGLAALLIIALLHRTRLAQAGTVLAVLVPTAIIAAVGAASVARVKDTGSIPSGIPAPGLPDFHLFSAGMISGALAVAVIIVVQGAGVSEVARPGKLGPPPINHDLLAEGIGNVTASVLQGIPVGAALGQTSVNVKAGAQTRLAAVACGALMAVILAAFSGAVGDVAIPTLSAILIYFGLSSFRVGELRTIMRTGPGSQVALVATLIATLLLPVAVAVGIGVALSLLLKLNHDAMDVGLVELIPLDDGRLAECDPPSELRNDQVTILDVYGSLVYAGSWTLQGLLPKPVSHAVLVLRLRGRTALGATFLKVMGDYADVLADESGRLYLSGLSDEIVDWLRHSGRVGDAMQLVGATPVLGESTYSAYLEGATWLTSGRAEAAGRG